MNLSSSITDFLKYLKSERKVSPKTIENYNHCLKRFLEFTVSVNSGHSEGISPLEIDLQLIQKYRVFLSRWSDPETGKPLKKVTQNYFLIALRAFLRYLHDQDQAFLPAERIKLEKAGVMSTKILDAQSLALLLEAPDILTKHGLRDKALLQTIFSTGLRVSELANLNRDDISFSHIDPRVSLSPMAVKWLDQYMKSRKDTLKPLFIRFQGKVDLRSGGERMRLTPRSIERIVEKYVKRTGLSVKATPHTLRYVQNGLPAKPKY